MVSEILTASFEFGHTVYKLVSLSKSVINDKSILNFFKWLFDLNFNLTREQFKRNKEN